MGIVRLPIGTFLFNAYEQHGLCVFMKTSHAEIFGIESSDVIGKRKSLRCARGFRHSSFGHTYFIFEHELAC